MKTIVCFGDSNTHGYDSKTMGRFEKQIRWTGYLQNELGEKYDIVEEGLSGRTTVFEDPLTEGLNGLDMIYPVLMSHEPVDLLIVMLGTNDVKQRFHATPENIAKGLERLIQKAKSTQEAFQSEPKILIIAPAPIEKGYEDTFVYGEMGPDCVEKTEKLVSLYEEVAKKNDCFFLDAGSIPGMGMYPYDYMHLSPEAHEALAKELTCLIPSLFER